MDIGLAYAREARDLPSLAEQFRVIDQEALARAIDVVSRYRDQRLDFQTSDRAVEVPDLTDAIMRAPHVGRIIVWDRSVLRVPGWGADTISELEKRGVEIIEVARVRTQSERARLARLGLAKVG